MSPAPSVKPSHGYSHQLSPSPTRWHVCYNWWRILTRHSHPEFTLRLSLGVVWSNSLDKCITTYPSLYSTENFHCPKSPLCSAYSSFPPFHIFFEHSQYKWFCLRDFILPLGTIHSSVCVPLVAWQYSRQLCKY